MRGRAFWELQLAVLHWAESSRRARREGEKAMADGPAIVARASAADISAAARSAAGSNTRAWAGAPRAAAMKSRKRSLGATPADASPATTASRTTAADVWRKTSTASVRR